MADLIARATRRVQIQGRELEPGIESLWREYKCGWGFWQSGARDVAGWTTRCQTKDDMSNLVGLAAKERQVADFEVGVVV